MRRGALFKELLIQTACLFHQGGYLGDSKDSFFFTSIDNLHLKLMKTPSQLLSGEHPFFRAPNRTFLVMSIPVLFSMVAEPVTGLVDTAFVARLGSVPLAALGVGTMLLSGFFWVFNFLSIGSQTEVAQALGRKEQNRASEIGFLALLVAFILGIMILVFTWSVVPTLVGSMGASDGVFRLASSYVRIRLFGAPAVLITIAAFGIMRGLQDMRTPLWIAVSVNLMNILLDGVLIFGLGPVPALGIEGAAIATALSQWIGAIASLILIYLQLGRPEKLRASDTKRLFQIGGDMFIRTGLLLFYLMMATRTATKISAEAGAAHQAIRQFWTFTALFLDAFSVTAQSLIAYFTGQRDIREARHVARIICNWSVLAGFILGFIMIAGQGVFEMMLVPPDAVIVFSAPWLIASISQPLNAIAFATDGIHWGTGDFGYLRNGMIAATAVGLSGILFLEYTGTASLNSLWIVTVLWIFMRSLAGFIRVWPGIGDSPLKLDSTSAA